MYEEFRGSNQLSCREITVMYDRFVDALNIRHIDRSILERDAREVIYLF